jgi:hypothetical protein
MEYRMELTDQVMLIRGEASPLLPWPASLTLVNWIDDGVDDASVHNSVSDEIEGLILLLFPTRNERVSNLILLNIF